MRHAALRTVRLARSSLLSSLLACSCGLSAAQEVMPVATPSIEGMERTTLAGQNLYLEAMQAIAEGRKNDASRILQKMVEQEPQHAGAWLDLALIQCELGHGEAAHELFQEIERRFAPPTEIMQIIQMRRQLGCKPPAARGNWNILLTRGYEQNVNQGASNPFYSLGGSTVPSQLLPDFLPKADRYLMLAADYTREVNQNGDLLFTQFQGRRNDDLAQYDSASLFVGMEHAWRWGNWAMRGSGMFGLLGLGGQLYQKQTQIQIKLTPPLPLPENMQFQLASSVSHLQYLTLANFDANTFELRGQLQYKRGETLGTVSMAWLNDHATDARPGGRRHGWQASISARRRLQPNLYGEMAWTRQTWVGASAYSPGFINEVRDQNMQSLRAALIMPWGERQSLQLEMRQVWNKENISIFQYNNRQIQLSWLWQSR